MRQVIYETFFTKAPGRDRLRKTAEARRKSLVRDGWHEVSRAEAGPDAIRVRYEREVTNRPLPPLRKKPEPPPRRTGDRGRRFGGPGQRFGGPGQRGGGPGQRGAPGGAPGQQRGAPGGAPGQQRGAPRGAPGQQGGAPSPSQPGPPGGGAGAPPA